MNKLCLHTNIILDHGINLCMDCGIEVIKVINWMDELQDVTQINNQQYSIKNVKSKSIYDDVQHLNISQKIKDIANDIYLSICENTRRGVTRKGIIFACIFHAYKIDKNPQTHDKLIKEFQINKKDALNGLKFIHKNAPKDSIIRYYYISVENIITDFMSKFDNMTQSNKSDVLELYDKIKNSTNILSRSRPQSIASALIYYYMTNILGKKINIKDYTRVVNLSELTIQKICKEIEYVFELFKITEYIQTDNVEQLQQVDIPEFVYKKIEIINDDMNFCIQKHIKISPLDFAKEINSSKCIEFLQNKQLK